MKKTFRAYYPPDERELQDLWDRGLIVLDANALLVFFRYSASTRDEFLRVLTGKKDSLWLPYQVGLEFHRNWLCVVAEQRNAFDRTIDALTKLDSQVTDTLSKLNIKRHTALDADRIRKRLLTRITKVKTEVVELQEKHRESLRSGDDNDVLNKIAALFDGRVGTGPARPDQWSSVPSTAEATCS